MTFTEFLEAFKVLPTLVRYYQEEKCYEFRLVMEHNEKVVSIKYELIGEDIFFENPLEAGIKTDCLVSGIITDKSSFEIFALQIKFLKAQEIISYQ